MLTINSHAFAFFHFTSLITKSSTRKEKSVPTASFIMLLSSLNISVHLILIGYLASSANAFASHKGNETDQLALLHIKGKVTNDPFGVLSTWNESIHFCNWLGVTCNTRRHPQRVIKLDLQSQKLVGSISPHVGNLSFLRTLQLQNNSFANHIPSELGYLRRLQILHLQNNSLGGQIPPNISSCYGVTRINLSNNVLVGTIPAQVGSLSKLQFLDVRINKLTGGIPTSFGNLSSLREFYANSNNISGSVPDALGHITGLTILELSNNKLSGTLPRRIFNLSSIEGLSVALNQIHGSLPSNIGLTLPNLMFLGVSFNRFTGLVPTSISNATSLEIISLEANQLTGKMPTLENLQKIQILGISINHLGSGEDGDDDLSFFSSLINATDLVSITADDNKLKGMLPEAIGNFSSRLRTLALADNHIYGRIPSGMGNLISLELISLWGNHLTSNIPGDIGEIRNLKKLFFDDNKLSGELPSSLGNLSMLLELSVSSNNFQGHIPTSLERCKNLLNLDLSQNNLSDTLSPNVMPSSTLVNLNISHNYLTGPIPIEVGDLINIEVLDVSENNFYGEIPGTLGRCVRLEILIMEGNFLHGAIPSSLSSLRGLEFIDLSHNNLSGAIPKYLERFTTLQTLNISFNDFEGAVPNEGIFKNETGISLVGNDKLCGGVLQLQLPKCTNSERSKNEGLGLAMKVIMATISTLSGLALILCFFLCYWFKNRRGVTPPSISLENALVKVSFQSLLKATNGFSSTNLVGMGRFGQVYKGSLVELGGKVVAVKVFNLFRSGGCKSFIAECEALRSVRHRNLVKVLTACSSVDFNGNEFKAIVYEFMDNGSLDEWLHPNISTDEDLVDRNEEHLRKLTLIERLNVAIDVASAVKYLHCDCEPQIIHCDLKPSNILIDNEMTGHLGDLGLARLLPQEPQSLPANQTSSIAIRGTVGFADPEYGMGTDVSAYGDVYSFGILLLEMFTGKRPTDEMFKDNLNLHEFSKMAFPDKMVETIDPILLQQEGAWDTRPSNATNRSQSHIEMSKVQECLILLLRIGIACSEESPRGRLVISEVLAKLQTIKSTLTTSG